MYIWVKIELIESTGKLNYLDIIKNSQLYKTFLITLENIDFSISRLV